MGLNLAPEKGSDIFSLFNFGGKGDTSGFVGETKLRFQKLLHHFLGNPFSGNETPITGINTSFKIDGNGKNQMYKSPDLFQAQIYQLSSLQQIENIPENSAVENRNYNWNEILENMQNELTSSLLKLGQFISIPQSNSEPIMNSIENSDSAKVHWIGLPLSGEFALKFQEKGFYLSEQNTATKTGGKTLSSNRNLSGIAWIPGSALNDMFTQQPDANSNENDMAMPESKLAGNNSGVWVQIIDNGTPVLGGAVLENIGSVEETGTEKQLDRNVFFVTVDKKNVENMDNDSTDLINILQYDMGDLKSGSVPLVVNNDDTIPFFKFGSGFDSTKNSFVYMVENLFSGDVSELPSVANNSSLINYSIDGTNLLQQIVDQVTGVLQTSELPDKRSIPIVLKTENLGELTFSLEKTGSQQNAILNVSQPEIREFLNGQKEALQKLFQENNLPVDKLEIVTALNPAIGSDSQQVQQPGTNLLTKLIAGANPLQQIVDRVTGVMQSSESPAKLSTVIMLKPETLGELTFSLEKTGTQHNVILNASQPETGEFLNGQKEALHKLFQENNLPVDKLEIATASNPAAGLERQQARQPGTNLLTKLIAGANPLQQIVDRVTGVMQSSESPAKLSTVIVLKPETLGELTFSLEKTGNQQNAILHVSHPELGAFLNGQKEVLQKLLLERNLPVDKLEIHPVSLNPKEELQNPEELKNIKINQSPSVTNLIAKSKEIIVKQLVEQLSEFVQKYGETENGIVQSQLKPENLGKIQISSTKLSGDLNYIIQFENKNVKQVVESDPKYFKQSLAENHVKIKNVEFQNYQFSQNENSNHFGHESKTNFFRIDQVPGGEQNIKIENMKFSELLHFTKDLAVKDIPIKHITAQIVHFSKLQYFSDKTQIQVQLKPEYLGLVKIVIQDAGGEIKGVLYAERPEVRHALEAHLPALQKSFSEQNIKMDRLEVQDFSNQFANHNNSSDLKEWHKGANERSGFTNKNILQNWDEFYPDNPKSKKEIRDFGYNTLELTV